MCHGFIRNGQDQTKKSNVSDNPQSSLHDICMKFLRSIWNESYSEIWSIFYIFKKSRLVGIPKNIS